MENVLVDFGQVGISVFISIVKRLRFAKWDMKWVFRLDFMLRFVAMLGGGGGRNGIGRSRRVLNEYMMLVQVPMYVLRGFG
jgi:hypothetical protein